MLDMTSVEDLKVFVPAQNYAVAKQFYLDLGFTEVWEGDPAHDAALGAARSLSQRSRGRFVAYRGQTRRLRSLTA